MGKKHPNDHKSGRPLPDSLISGVRKRPPTVESLAQTVDKAQSASEQKKAARRDRTPMPPGFMHQGRVDQVAIELNLLTHDWRKNWRAMERPGRITFLSALATMVSVFLPWVSTPQMPYSLGILSGGGIHLALSIFAIYLLTSRKRLLKRMNRRGSLNRGLRLWMRRIAMWHIFLGSISTLAGICFLIYYGFVKRQHGFESVTIHWGFYVTLFFGAGLAFGGWSHFSRYPQES
ncbi:MAG: hypothetical protein CMH56_12075 [Myxococcales bacterium]|nr:hypothetical protein [Myxococcales bacterium]|tara:strand:+ start:1630 stop:2328 length:699 start_codon:yes stop_codon:yes gene_type:complete